MDANNQGNVPPAFDPGQTIAVPTQAADASEAPRSPYAGPAPSGSPSTGYSPTGQPGAGYPYSGYSRPVARNDRDRTLLALILISAGVLFLFDQFHIFAGFGDLVLLVIGGVFLYAYFNTRSGHRIGFLIPGAILLGIGAGQVISDMPFVRSVTGDHVTALTMGLGFCLIWLLERKHWWALIPGGVLMLGGLSSVVGNFWPLALIAIGVYLIYDQSRRRPAH